MTNKILRDHNPKQLPTLSDIIDYRDNQQDSLNKDLDFWKVAKKIHIFIYVLHVALNDLFLFQQEH